MRQFGMMKVLGETVWDDERTWLLFEVYEVTS